MSELSQRHAAIVERRARDATLAVLAAIGSAEVMFLAFAVGSSLGPVPLRPAEILIGSTATFLLGGIFAFWLTWRRHRRGARLASKVREGRKQHRVVVFDEYLTIGREVILKQAVESIQLDDRGLVIRYRDPRHEGPVLRELTGDRGRLEQLIATLR